MRKVFIRNMIFGVAMFTAALHAATLADAQKAYVSGKWAEAASLFEQVCPTITDSSRTECELWNILALSQTGVRTDFNKAGKSLDALIQKTPKENSLYSELFMTRAQLLLYLDKYDKAAEALISAIEYSKPKQYLVLQKVCTAVLPKVRNATLKDYCPRLSDPSSVFTPKVDTLVQDSAVAPQATPAPTPVAAPAQAQPVPAKPAPAPVQQPAPQPAPQAATPAPQPAAPVQPAPIAQQMQQPAPQPAPAPQAAPQAAPASGEWALQLGAFGVKGNADQLAAKMKDRGYNCIIVERQGETKTLHLVQIVGFSSKEQAMEFGAQNLTPQNQVFQAVLRK